MDKTEAVKALKALAHCYKTKCSECEFSGKIPGRRRSCGLPDDDEIMEGAIEYIEAQQKELDQQRWLEPVEPEIQTGSGVSWWYICGNCKTALNPKDKFCHECGRRIKWE